VAIDLSDAMVECVGNIEVSNCIHSHAIRAGQRGAYCRPAVTREALVSVAHYCCDYAVEVYLSDTIVGGISDVQISAAVHSDGLGSMQ
jgi:hypothetical protein